MTTGDSEPPAPVSARGQRSASSAHARLKTQCDFAHRVSHTLRGDIHAVRTALSAALNQTSALSLPTPARDALARVEQAVAHMERRALDIALLARADAGALDLEREPHRLRWVVQDAVRANRPTAAKAGVTLRCDVETCGAMSVPLDRELLLRALGALLHNAIRFSPAGGVVTVCGEIEEGVARIVVRDQGSGFAPGDAKRVFAPFAVGENEQDGSGNGLGLGLSVARAIIEAHGGRVQIVKSKEPGGAVAVELPLA